MNVNGYFDYNATTPLSPAASAAWLRAGKFWHNPSSLYREAAEARRALDEARDELAVLLGCEPERIVFTSGATESNNAILAHLAATLPVERRALSSSIEHPCVREPLRHYFGARVTLLRATPRGELDLGDLESRLKRGDAGLVTAMAANNECGLLHPWREIARLCHESGALFHTDAAQWIGKLPSEELGRCDYISGCAHKFGGPKGAGFLVLRDGGETIAFLRGGPQEEGRRAGTENLPGVAAMVAALRDLAGGLEAATVVQPARRDAFERAMEGRFGGLRVIGAGADRLWNTTMFVLPRHDNRKWLARLSRRGFCVSTGSACSGGHDGSSVVLAALGADEAEMRRVIRVSGGWDTAEADWGALAEAFAIVGDELDQEAARK